MNPIERCPNIRHDVFISYVIDKFRLMEQELRLTTRSAQYQRLSLLTAPVRQTLQRMQACRIKRGHMAKPKHDNGTEDIETFGCGFEFICRPK